MEYKIIQTSIDTEQLYSLGELHFLSDSQDLRRNASEMFEYKLSSFELEVQKLKQINVFFSRYLLCVLYASGIPNRKMLNDIFSWIFLEFVTHNVHFLLRSMERN